MHIGVETNEVADNEWKAENVSIPNSQNGETEQ